MKASTPTTGNTVSIMLTRVFPKSIIDTLLYLRSQLACKMYVVGGTVRDILLGECPQDLDVVVDYDLRIFRQKLSEKFDCSRSVILGKGKQITLKICYQNFEIDIAQLAENASGIEEDLIRRDFTINAMAFPLEKRTIDFFQKVILDPLQGRDDLLARRLRMCPNAFITDPVRMIRGFRLSATKNLNFENATLTEINRRSHLLVNSAGERIRHELDRIMDCPEAENIIQSMFTSGLLRYLLPQMHEDEVEFSEILRQKANKQYRYDRLKWLESFIRAPDALDYIPVSLKDVSKQQEKIRQIKYAGFLQDNCRCIYPTNTQQPAKRSIIRIQQEEIIFIEKFARKMKWSNKDHADILLLSQKGYEIIELCALHKKGQLQAFAVLQFCRQLPRERVDDAFLLALANCSENSHEDCEFPRYYDLVQFHPVLLAFIDDTIQPHLLSLPLLSGRDLQQICFLQPGPHFKEILCEVDRLQLEGKVTSRDEAIDWVTHTYKKRLNYSPGTEWE